MRRDLVLLQRHDPRAAREDTPAAAVVNTILAQQHLITAHDIHARPAGLRADLAIANLHLPAAITTQSAFLPPACRSVSPDSAPCAASKRSALARRPSITTSPRCPIPRSVSALVDRQLLGIQPRPDVNRLARARRRHRRANRRVAPLPARMHAERACVVPDKIAPVCGRRRRRAHPQRSPQLLQPLRLRPARRIYEDVRIVERLRLIRGIHDQVEQDARWRASLAMASRLQAAERPRLQPHAVRLLRRWGADAD